jgi:hypothetical protein
MKITIYARNYTAIMACLLMTAACAAPIERSAYESSLSLAWAKVEQQENAALRRQARRQSVGCAGDEVAVCEVSGRLGKRLCSCERVTSELFPMYEEPMSDDF